MAEMRKRTSMSVLEMGRMLGLGKTESYWLIKKELLQNHSCRQHHEGDDRQL